MSRCSQRHRRVWSVLALLAVIGLGLAWRSPALGLPWLVAKYGGDALWALAVYCGFAFLLPRAPTRTLALLSVVFAFGIEVSQLYHAPWIDSIRSLRLGQLVLGSTFNAPDLLAYAAGILAGASADRVLRRWG